MNMLGLLVLVQLSGSIQQDQGSAALRLELTTTISGHEFPFGRVGAVVGDDMGRIYVADVQAREIIVFDSAGRLQQKLGRPGPGPGEFSRLQGTMAWLGETLVAADAGVYRLTLFNTAEGSVATAQWPHTLVPPNAMFSGQDVAYAASREPRPIPRLSPDEAPPPVRPVPLRFVRIRTGGALEMLAVRDSVTITNGMFCMAPDRSVVHPLSTPFSDDGPTHAFLPTGELAIADETEYRIRILDPNSGNVISVIQRSVAHVPVADEQWESIPEVVEYRNLAQEAGGRLLQLGGEPCPFDDLRPEYWPAIRSLAADEHGRLWVESSSRAGTDIAVFNRDGQLLGMTQMPPRDRSVAPFVSADRLYLTRRDGFDVQSIQVYRAVLSDGEE